MRGLSAAIVVGFAFVVGGCSGSDAPAPIAGAGSGGESTASADGFTNTVAQTAASSQDSAEPSTQLAQQTPSTPEDSEPANI